VVDVNTAAAEMTSSPSAVISAVAVTKSWGNHQVFSDVTADVLPGVTGLLGSNGSGKTTLLGMLLALHHPDSGKLTVLGEDPATAGPDLRMHIGYAPEHHTLPDDVAAQDLVRHIALVHGLPKREATTRSSDALWLVGLGEERARPIGTMSTGQRQRVKLAQAIAHGPKLVLLDEPTDGLDPVQRDDMLALIRRIGTEFGIHVLLSSHLLEEVERIAENVVILSNGTVRASGPIDDLRTGQGGMVAVVDEGVELVASTLRASGYEVELDRNRVRVGSDEPIDQLADALRDAIAEHDVPLRRMEPVTQSLEDLFLDEVYGS
jgi:ABC-2 type transport system ATP-binding protein